MFVQVAVVVALLPHAALASSGFQKGPSVPVIDLSSTDDDRLAKEISLACSTLGFFQVTNHGISDDLQRRFREQCALYFDLNQKLKQGWKRNSACSRGYFNDELTKQKRDWKECLDVGVPGSRDWNIADESELNGEIFCVLDISFQLTLVAVEAALAKQDSIGIMS